MVSACSVMSILADIPVTVAGGEQFQLDLAEAVEAATLAEISFSANRASTRSRSVSSR
jgi:hypothetical protein